MARSTRLALSLVVSFALAAPSLAGAQAVPRGSSSSGSSGSGSSGSSGSSSGGSSGSSSSGSSSSGGSSTSSSSGGSGSSVSRSPSRIPSSSSSASRTGSGGARSAPQPGGVVSGGGRSLVAGSGESSSVRSGSTPGGALTAVSRDRNGRALSGTAIPRRTPDLSQISFPLYGPWGNWYPWYGSGFGWNLGYVTYNPWYYGPTRWYYGRYGFWYDPFIYDPYWYDPYYPHDGGYSSRSGRDYDEPKRMTGSIRLKVTPNSARVYIDGALVGTVDEFDGLQDHLELDGGKHTIELRADGYEIYRGEIDVAVGKTLTERVSLKKIKK